MTKSIAYVIPRETSQETVSFAGECPLTDWLVFGTDEGRVLAPIEHDADGSVNWRSIVSGLGDVVNGVAFSQRHAAISTPSAISIVRAAIESPEELGDIVATIPAGAFDVIAIGPERFLAPMGIYGLMVASVDDYGHIHAETLGHADQTYFYMTRLVERQSNLTIIASAGRQNGLIRLKLPNEGPADVGIFTFNEIDVVDVCPFPRPGAPLAVVALGINGELIVCDDLVNGVPVAVRIPHIRGRSYSLRRVGPHLVILTKKSVHIFENFLSAGQLLAERKLTGQDIRIRSFEDPPSEVYVAKDSLLITERGETAYVDDIETILGSQGPLESTMQAPSERARNVQHDWSNPAVFSESPSGIDAFPLTRNVSLNSGPIVVA
jgi:hypothetical protein